MNNTPSEKRDFIPFVVEMQEGSPIFPHSLDYNNASLVNCAVMTAKDANSPIKRKVIGRPRITGQAELASAVIRGLFYDSSQGSTWYVIGDTLTVIHSGGTDTATLASSTGEVYFEHYRYGSTNGILVCEAGSNFKVNLFSATAYTLSGSVSTSLNVLAPPVVIDGTVYAMAHDTQRIYNSNVGDPVTWTTANDFIDAEQVGDRLLGIAKYKNYLVAWGPKSTEFFYNAAVELGSPLRRQTQYSLNLGIIPNSNYTRQAFTDTANGLFWIGASEGQGFGVFKLNNFVPVKVSTPFVERMIQNAVEYAAYGQINVGLSSMAFLGKDVVMLTLYSTFVSVTPDAINLVYDPVENLWYDWRFKDGASPLEIKEVISRKDDNIFAAYNQTNYDLYYLTKAPSDQADNTDPSTASITTETFDFGTQNYKLIKSVDLLGKYDDGSSFTLRYTGQSDAQSFTNAGSKSITTAGQGQSLRWLSLGRHPRITFNLEVDHDRNFVLDGLYITYIEGTR